ncbi:MAG: hypothetical protein Q4F35_01310 [Akkermansia sp.]|nr:hypothetical protein [Akkermansia sp.]
MKRLNYIYWAVPLYVLLSCGSLLTGLLGNGVLMLVVAFTLIIVTWGVVWMRLFTGGRLRPEFAILGVLPHSAYYLATFFQSRLFTDPNWQNMFGLSWLVFAIIMIISLRPGRADEHRERVAKDRTFILMSILTVAYSFATMSSFANQLFYLQ